MLQALGSTTKAKIAYSMFGGCCIMVIGAFYVAQIERVIYDDSYAYCATIYYSPKIGYRIDYWGQRNDFDKISSGCARACYKDQKTVTGWTFLEIETQSGYNDEHQAIGAGMLEGSLTWMNIYAQWTNTIQSFCERDEDTYRFCDWLRDIIKINHQNVLNLTSGKVDHYHYQVHLFYQQLMGIEIGFKKGVQRARRDYEIPSADFLLLNARVDIDDLKMYYNQFVTDDDELGPLKLSQRVGKMMLKVVKSDEHAPEILMGHSSDGDYSSMLKMMKTYRFAFHHGPPTVSNRLVANTDITFSSYPGSIASTDDFYHLMGKHSRLIVGGVRMKNVQLQRGIDLEGTIMMSARVMAANRLAHNGQMWSHIMTRDPDIGAKQWLVVDEKRMKFLYTDGHDGPLDGHEASLEEPEKDDNDIASQQQQQQQQSNNNNLIWLIDQTYGRLHAEDVTLRFKNNDGSWTIDGTPFFKEIQELNKMEMKNVKEDGKVENLNDLEHNLRLQAHRGDLQKDPIPFGNIDIKLYSSHTHQMIVQSGPVTSPMEPTTNPFDWNSEQFHDIHHLEHPSLWNFQAIKVQFLWN